MSRPFGGKQFSPWECNLSSWLSFYDVSMFPQKLILYCFYFSLVSVSSDQVVISVSVSRYIYQSMYHISPRSLHQKGDHLLFLEIFYIVLSSFKEVWFEVILMPYDVWFRKKTSSRTRRLETYETQLTDDLSDGNISLSVSSSAIRNL